MKRILSLILIFALCLLGFTVPAAAEEADTITITDHAGNEVTLPKEINRIVVTDIYPMASVLTVFLGSADKLVGIHSVSMTAAENGILGELYPEILRADTSFMAGAELNIEALMALEPDLVFYNAGSKELGETIRSAGLNAVGVSVNKWDYNALDTYDAWIALLAELFPDKGETAEKISQFSHDTYDLIQTRIASLTESEKRNILFLFSYSDTAIVTSGKNFFGQYWATAVGGRNVAEGVEAENSNAKITMEQIYEWNPDVIFITNFTPVQPADLAENAIAEDDWSTVAAVENGEVYKLPLGTYRTYTPNADAPTTLLWMAQKVYPALFADIDINAVVKDYYEEMFAVTLTDEQVTRMYNPSVAAAADVVK